MDKYQSSWSSDIHNDNIMEGSTNSEHASNSSKTATDNTIEDFIPLESFESLKSGLVFTNSTINYGIMKNSIKRWQYLMYLLKHLKLNI